MSFQIGNSDPGIIAAMRDIDLKTLRLLVAVCDHQNMARAAEQEHIEPSAISKRIAQLEARPRHAAADALAPRRRSRRRPAWRCSSMRARAVHDGAHRQRRRRRSAAASRATCAWSRRSRRSPSRCSTTSPRSCASRPTATSRSTSRSACRATLVRQLREGGASVGVCWDHVDLEGLEHRPYRQRPAGARGPSGPSARRSQVAALRADAGPRARRPAADDARCTPCCSAPRRAVGRTVSLPGRRLELRRRVPRRRRQPRRSASSRSRSAAAYAAMLGIAGHPADRCLGACAASRSASRSSRRCSRRPGAWSSTWCNARRRRARPRRDRAARPGIALGLQVLLASLMIPLLFRWLA